MARVQIHFKESLPRLSLKCDQGPMLWFFKYFRQKIRQKIVVITSTPGVNPTIESYNL
jgi:hypothetical protein